MNEIFDFFSLDKKFIDLVKDKKTLNVGNEESLAFLCAYKFYHEQKSMVIVLENLLACQNLYNKLVPILKDKVFIYSVDEITKFNSIATSCEMSSQRLYVLNKLLNKELVVVITHTMAVKRITPSVTTFKRKCLNLKINDELKVTDLLYKLTTLGYKNVLQVTQPFEYSTRGGVIDVFSINYDLPIRIEFFDTIIDSLRFFDVSSQRTVSKVSELNIIPATEFLIDDLDAGINKIKDFSKIQIKNSQNNLQLESVVNDDISALELYEFNESLYKYYYFFNSYGSLADYLTDCEVYIVNENKIKDNENFILNEEYENIIEHYEDGSSLKDFYLYDAFSLFKDKLNDVYSVSVDVTNQINDFYFVKVDAFDFNLDLLYKKLVSLMLEHYTIFIGLDSLIHYQSIKQLLIDKELKFYETDGKNIKKGAINLANKDYGIGLDFINYKFYAIGENEIFKKRFKSSISQFSRYKDAITIESVNDLEIGDYLVHEAYGIGIYQGIETMLNNGLHRDYIKIEYKNSDLLYLPLEQFKLVRKYVSKEGAKPKINRLGSKEWEKTKARINERVNEIAEKLVSLYSSRSQKDGFCFAKDDDLQEAFEADFAYELTSDQANVLKEIKKDMEAPIIMDRLLVGDVGFGKTEIALRAAFKAINSGKQVAFLCPTTLLARQHYLTALDRFKNFGVHIKMVSRMVTDKEINETLNDLKEGKIELIIGTHRLLSSDVKFKDLGLLIVDEEHKFGVEHKEKIKEFKQNVDVLTLTATPIPRTLQMALTGVRGFSTINTPIENRMPVQTYVIKKDTKAIKEIIERELARGGQVFYLNNHIERLPAIALEIEKLVKSAKVAIAHGKLSQEQTEDIMQRFINNEFNVLLCTTIIENGIDIPNVNTIIVENADCFGLSQLYQIKGRVGRSDRLAYAYLMYNGNKELSEIATKRLQTIKEFTALGSGYKVAMRDLITRGAGDMLGPEQSGFIESVGIDMYIDMLNKAIVSKKNHEEIKVEKPTFNKMMQVDAYIPNKYFTNDYEKIDLYKRIDKTKNFNELASLKDELIDKTGKLPASIAMLFEKKSIDLFVNFKVLDSYDDLKDKVVLKFSKEINKYKGIGIPIFEISCAIPSKIVKLKFLSNQIIAEIAKKDDNWLSVASDFVSSVAKLIKKYEEVNNEQ